jgi:hypothetical protein
MALGGKHRVIPEEAVPAEDIVSLVKNVGRKALEDFRKLFFCYRTPSPIDLKALELLADAIVEKYLDVETEFISIEPKIKETYQDIGKGRVVESGQHQGMKEWVIDFLKSTSVRATDEVSLLGYQIDVGCLKKKIFVECGDTEPKKIFTLLFKKHSIGILQYDSEYIVWFRPNNDFHKHFEKAATDYFGLY